MEHPADCGCHDCVYARWFAELDPEQLAYELDLIYTHCAPGDND